MFLRRERLLNSNLSTSDSVDKSRHAMNFVQNAPEPNKLKLGNFCFNNSIEEQHGPLFANEMVKGVVRGRLAL